MYWRKELRLGSVCARSVCACVYDGKALEWCSNGCKREGEVAVGTDRERIGERGRWLSAGHEYLLSRCQWNVCDSMCNARAYF